MNRDQLKGRIDRARRKVKEFTGRLFGNRWSMGKGQIEETGGKNQAGYSDPRGNTTDWPEVFLQPRRSNAKRT
jgi:uncharacterized protein YjbJ (UPF0337 family)